MSNICYTDWIFVGSDNEIADLYSRLKEAMKNTYTELPERYDCSKKWLGNIVAFFGGNPREINTHGVVTEINLQTINHITLSTETDNNDMVATWKFVCSKYKTILFYYLADERAASGVWTNDKEGRYFPYRFELNPDNCETQYYNTKQEVLKEVSEILKTPIKSIDEAEKKVDEYNLALPTDEWYKKISFLAYMVVDKNGECIN